MYVTFSCTKQKNMLNVNCYTGTIIDVYFTNPFHAVNGVCVLFAVHL